MTHLSNRVRTVATVAAAIAVTASAVQNLSAQLPNATAAALGMGENYTAVARGFNSTAWNPAGLGVYDNPKVSFGLLSIRGLAGLDPISYADFTDFEDGETVSIETRQAWLDEITAEGSEEGSFGVDVTLLAASVGRVGFQLSTSGRGVANIGPGAAELLFFGNAGRTGSAVDVSLAGSSFDAALTSTAALSYAQPLIRSVDRSFAIGATVKYIFGHAVASGRDDGGSVDADPLAVNIRFPLVASDTTQVYDKLDNGSGIGVDLGAMYVAGPWSIGVAAKNVFNSFEWDETSLFFRPGEAVFNQDDSDSDFDPQPFTAAPASIRERVENMVGQAEFSAGLAFRPNRRLLLSGDFRQRMEDSYLGESKTHIGAGLELRPLSFLPIRLGGAILDDGRLGSVGVGLEFGVINLTASAAQRDTDLGMDQMVMFTFSSMRR